MNKNAIRNEYEISARELPEGHTPESVAQHFATLDEERPLNADEFAKAVREEFQIGTQVGWTQVAGVSLAGEIVAHDRINSEVIVDYAGVEEVQDSLRRILVSSSISLVIPHWHH